MNTFVDNMKQFEVYDNTMMARRRIEKNNNIKKSSEESVERKTITIEKSDV